MQAEDSSNEGSFVDQVREFHRRLEAIAGAGVTIDFEDTAPVPEPLTRRLHELENHLESQSLRHAGYSREMLLTDTSLPLRYRIALGCWIANPNSQGPFEFLATRSRVQLLIRNWHRIAWVHPAIVTSLFLLALLLFLLVTFPATEEVYRQARVAPGAGTALIHLLHQYRWWWFPAVVVIVAGLFIRQFVRSWSEAHSRGPSARLIGSAQVVCLANQAASLLETGWTERDLRRLLLGDGVQRTQVPDPGAGLLMIDWALRQPAEVLEKKTVLRLIGSIYQHEQSLAERSLRRGLPTRLSVAVGGLLVGLLGLILFVPVIELLLAIAVSQG